MSGLVVDASIVVAWLFDDEGEPRWDRVLKQLVEDEVLVPPLWRLETRNSLLTAERRGRLSPSEVRERLDALKGLPISNAESDLQTAFDSWQGHMDCPCTTPYTWS